MTARQGTPEAAQMKYVIRPQGEHTIEVTEVGGRWLATVTPTDDDGLLVYVDGRRRRWLAKVTPADDDGSVVHLLGLSNTPPQGTEAGSPVYTAGHWWTPRDTEPDDVALEVIRWVAVLPRAA